MTFDEAINYIKRNPEPILALLQPAKKKGQYVCPLCGHGKGGDGLDIEPLHKTNGVYTFNCFGCKKHGDMITLFGEMNHYSKTDRCKEAIKLYGIEIEKDTRTRPAPAAPKAAPAASIEPEWISKGRAKIQQEIPADGGAAARREAEGYMANERDLGEAAAYLEARGLDDTTIARFAPGCDPAGQWAVIFYPGEPSPYWNERAIDANNKQRYNKPKSEIMGCSRAFNRPALTCGDEIVFCTEGEIDAMSIEQMGGAAIACKSPEELWAAILRAGDRLTAKTIVYIPDNDENPTNAEGYANKIQEAADAAGLAGFIRHLPTEAAGVKVKDANDLLRRDPDFLFRWLAETSDWLENERPGQKLRRQEAERRKTDLACRNPGRDLGTYRASNPKRGRGELPSCFNGEKKGYHRDNELAERAKGRQGMEMGFKAGRAAGSLADRHRIPQAQRIFGCCRAV